MFIPLQCISLEWGDVIAVSVRWWWRGEDGGEPCGYCAMLVSSFSSSGCHVTCIHIRRGRGRAHPDLPGLAQTLDGDDIVHHHCHPFHRLVVQLFIVWGHSLIVIWLIIIISLPCRWQQWSTCFNCQKKEGEGLCWLTWAATDPGQWQCCVLSPSSSSLFGHLIVHHAGLFIMWGHLLIVIWSIVVQLIIVQLIVISLPCRWQWCSTCFHCQKREGEGSCWLTWAGTEPGQWWCCVLSPSSSSGAWFLR